MGNVPPFNKGLFWFPAIIIFEIWTYAIIIYLFRKLPLQLYLASIHVIFYVFPCTWPHLPAHMPTRTCIDVKSLTPPLERVRLGKEVLAAVAGARGGVRVLCSCKAGGARLW